MREAAETLAPKSAPPKLIVDAGIENLNTHVDALVADDLVPLGDGNGGVVAGTVNCTLVVAEHYFRWRRRKINRAINPASSNPAPAAADFQVTLLDGKPTTSTH